jgi:hypothetical protein
MHTGKYTDFLDFSFVLFWKSCTVAVFWIWTVNNGIDNLQLVEHGQYLVEVEEVGFPNKIKAAMTCTTMV